VCVPTYNRSQFLGETVDSILAQTFQDFELIIHDNASTDGTSDLVETYLDPRIRYYRNRNHLGIADNWIAALGNARGTYCAALPDDDLWDPAFLATMVQVLDQHPEVVVAFADHWLVDQRGNVLEELTNRSSRQFHRDGLRPGIHRPFDRIALLDQSLPMVASLLRRDALADSLQAQAGYVIDYYILSRLALSDQGAYYVPRRLGFVRIHGASVSVNRFSQIWPDHNWACGDLYSRAETARQRRYIRLKWGKSIAWEATTMLRQKRFSALFPSLRRAFNQAPRGVRPRLALGVATAATSLLASASLRFLARGRGTRFGRSHPGTDD
jgi:glycosyltransferase involved in cell wall biosynthesis